MNLPLHGETVQVEKIVCANRGNFTEYRAYVSFVDEHNKRIEYEPGIKFGESVAQAFRRAGHSQVKYARGHVIPMERVDVVLEAVDNHYQISDVYASNGTIRKVEQTVTRFKKQAEWTKEMVAENRKKYTDPSTLRRLALKQAERDRFIHGEKLIRWQLDNNPFILVIVGDEWMCFKKTEEKIA